MPEQQGPPSPTPDQMAASQPQQPPAPQPAPAAAAPPAPPLDPNSPAQDDTDFDQTAPAGTPSANPTDAAGAATFLTQPTAAQDTHQQLNQEANNLKQDFNNGHITPETYHSLFAKKDTLGKIGMLFGLMVSGAGSGLAHQSNAAMDQMNKELDRDLEAQKVTKSNQFNALNLAEQHLKNQSEIGLQGKQGQLAEANIAAVNANTQLTKLTTAKTAMLLSAVQDLTGKVNNLPPGSPQHMAAQGALQQVSNATDQHINAMNAQTAAQVEANWQRHNAALNALSPEMAKYQSERHVPGMGEASIPVSGEDREALGSGQAFDQKLQRFIDWTKAHSETAALHPQDAKVGATLAAELQGAYRQATHGGVFKEGEQNFISKLIDSDPVSNLNKFTVVPQLEALQKEARERVNQKAKTQGLPGYQGSQSAPETAPQTMTSKSGKPMVMVNGKWHYKN